MRLKPGEEAREVITQRDGSLLVKMRGITLEQNPLAYSYVIPAKDALAWLAEHDPFKGTADALTVSPEDTKELNRLIAKASAAAERYNAAGRDVMTPDRGTVMDDARDEYRDIVSEIDTYTEAISIAQASTDKE